MFSTAIQLGEWIAFFALLFAAFTYWHSRILKDLESDSGRIELAQILARPTLSHHYREGILEFTKAWDRFFGPNPGWQTFSRCLQIAFVYPIALFVFAWTLGGSPTLSGVPTFDPEIYPGPPRWWRGVLVAILAVSVFFTFRDFRSRSGKIAAIADSASGRLLPQDDRTRKSRFVNAAIEVVIAFAVLAIVTMAAVAGTGGIAGVFVLATVVFAPTRDEAFAFIAGVSTPTVVLAMVISAVAVAEQLGASVAAAAGATAATTLVFFLILPFTNALVDAISWTATRHFTAKMLTARKVHTVFIDLAYDILIALACLLALVLLIPNTIELANLALPTPINWIDPATDALADPFGAGLLTTGMLLSTLVPTFLHITAGIGAIASSLAFVDFRNAVVVDLRSGGAFTLAKRNRAWRAVVLRRLWLFPAGLLIGGLAALLYWLGSLLFGPIGQTLFNLAICATAWSSEQTCGPLLAGFSF